MDDIDVDTLIGRRTVQRANRVSVGDIFERLTWSHPDRAAIIGCAGAYGDAAFATVTYRQADETANRVANALIAEGLAPGDRVAMFCNNSVEAILTMVGIAKAGMVCAPINPLMAPEVVARLIQDVGASFAVVDTELWPAAEKAFSAAGVAPRVSISIGGAAAPGSRPFAEWIAGAPSTEPEVAVNGDDVWALLFTSGTTTIPKASMNTHTSSYLASYTWALSMSRGLRFEDQFRVITFLPIVFHTGHHATLFAACLAGGTLVLGRRPDPAATAAAGTIHHATALWAGSPAFLQGIADVVEAEPAAFDLSSLTVGLFAWGAISPALAQRWKAFSPRIELLELLGQTESMSCTRFWIGQHPEKFEASGGLVNYVGRPNPILAATIMDPDGEILQGRPGVAGEAVYRSPSVTAGYYRNPAATREAFAHGWFHSGDSCMYDEDGLQIMLDRYKDVVQTGGETVSSLRVESAVAQHPGVLRVAVVGLPDQRWGEAVTAVIVLRAGHAPSAEDIIAFCRQKLAGYETPKRVAFVAELPETVGGKVLKYRLREELGGLADPRAAG